MAIAYTLSESARPSKFGSQAWLSWVLPQIVDHKITRLNEHHPSIVMLKQHNRGGMNPRQSAFNEPALTAAHT